MSIFISMPYDQVSQGVLKILSQFSTDLRSANEMINTLLTNDKLNVDDNFLNFVSHFEQGKYYQFRSEGYMEALVFTKAYNEMSLCYWINNLQTPATNHFAEAFSSLDRVSRSFLSDDDFRDLIIEVGALKQIQMKLIETIRMYNLNCGQSRF
ncbi:MULTISPECIES: hypothetical protein [unclassified Clostridium]|uniref:hypothetical protein n=1 Tax=unclassified Clostridium TaxID=2614128 RepID=UPI0025C1A576|nr:MULTISPECIES: hypothetical protein [unclassified Clostridium]